MSSSFCTIPRRRRATRVDDFVGARLRDRRISLGLTTQEFAERLGVTYEVVYKYERGISRISAGQLYEIARALHAPIDYFYEGFDAEKPHRVSVRRGKLLNMVRYLDEIRNEHHLDAISKIARALAGR
jgi:transcriptional regulator with XRE-family HTH domain